MVSRKILIALGVFAVLAIGIASVAAVQNIEVDGIKFAIPVDIQKICPWLKMVKWMKTVLKHSIIPILTVITTC